MEKKKNWNRFRNCHRRRVRSLALELLSFGLAGNRFPSVHGIVFSAVLVFSSRLFLPLHRLSPLSPTSPHKGLIKNSLSCSSWLPQIEEKENKETGSPSSLCSGYHVTDRKSNRIVLAVIIHVSLSCPPFCLILLFYSFNAMQDSPVRLEA